MDLNRKPFAEYQPELYDTFSKIMGLARELNTSLDPPEFVFIGQNNHGKTALLEAILGHSYTKDILNNLPPSPPSSTLSLAALSLLSHIPLFLVSFLDPCARKPTKRPVQINLLNNPACADPKVTVKRDDFLWSKSPEFCRDVEVPVDEIGKEMQKRNVYSTVPIYINYEWRQVWNMCLIDTPALVPSSKHFLGEDEEDTDTDREDEAVAGSSIAAEGEGAASASAAGAQAQPPSPAKAPPSNDSSVAGGDDKAGAGDDGADSGTESVKGRGRKSKTPSEDKKSARMQQTILELITPAERFIVAVEEAAAPTYVMPRVVQAIDPKYHRTVFEHLKTILTSKDVNKYLYSFQPNCRTFLTSFQPGSSAVYSKAQTFKDKIGDSIKDDMKQLESLQYDKRHMNAVGAHALRRYLLEQGWRHYLEVVPEILKNLSTKKNSIMAKLHDVADQLQSMESGRLRTLATAYAMSFLQNLERLVKGTLDGIPTQNGQTLEEEMDTPEVGDWLDLSFRPIMLYPDEWNIPYTQNKLYGKQQFERLLSQFRAITDHTEMGLVTMDDVACSAGPTKISTVSNFAWVASDLAKRKVEKTLKPLIQQLKNRAVYVLKRLVDIVDKMVAVQKMKKSAHHGPTSKMATSTFTLRPSAASVSRNNRHSTGHADKVVMNENSGDFPYFIHSVKVLFMNFVDEVAQDCFEKCQDEFFCTQIIYWDMVHFSEHTFPEKSNSLNLYQQKEEVTALARILYKEIKDRVSTNVLLKFHNFFFVPMQSDLWGAVQGKVTSLSDAQLSELFQVEPNKVALKEQETKLQAQMKALSALEISFMEHSSRFSRPQ